MGMKKLGTVEVLNQREKMRLHYLSLSIDARVELNCACEVSNKRSLYEREKTLACLFFCQAGMPDRELVCT